MSDGSSVQPPSPLDDPALSGDFRTMIVRALNGAYGAAGEQHAPEIGSNAVTFGTNVYAFGTFALRKGALARPELATDASTGQSFRLAVGDFIVACHKVGRSESDNIWTSFPDNEGAAARMAEHNQLWLPGMKPPRDPGAARHIVIAHMGNPDEGLRAVYLCVPDSAKDGKIVGWAFTSLVWRADFATETAAAETTDQRAPEERTEEPQVGRKKRKDRDVEDA